MTSVIRPFRIRGPSLILGEDQVQRTACVGQHLSGPFCLVRCASARNLEDRSGQLDGKITKIERILTHALASLVPGIAEIGAVFLDIGGAGVGQPMSTGSI